MKKDNTQDKERIKVHLEEGLYYFSIGEVIRAVDEWQKVLEIDPDNPLVRKYLNDLKNSGEPAEPFEEGSDISIDLEKSLEPGIEELFGIGEGEDGLNGKEGEGPDLSIDDLEIERGEAMGGEPELDRVPPGSRDEEGKGEGVSAIIEGEDSPVELRVDDPSEELDMEDVSSLSLPIQGEKEMDIELEDGDKTLKLEESISMAWRSPPPEMGELDELIPQMLGSFKRGDYESCLKFAGMALERSPDNEFVLGYQTLCREKLLPTYLKALSPATLVPVLNIEEEELKNVDMDQTAGFILGLINGRNTIGDIMKSFSFLGDFVISGILYRFLNERIIRMKKRGE